MKIRAIDADGDFEFGKGLASYKTKQDALIQSIKTRLLEWVGDCFFAADAGIDWNNRIGEKDEGSLLDQEIKSLIVRTEGVVQISDLAVVFSNRVLSVSYEILTIYSPSAQRIILREEIGGTLG